MSQGRLANKVAIVTGAGSVGPGWGNGKAIAALYVKEGAHVVGCDAIEKNAQQAQIEIGNEYGAIDVIKANVTNEADIVRLVEYTLKKHGRIDVLVNNVGIVRVGGAENLAVSDWEASLTVNLSSMFLMCKHVIPHMKKQGKGSIVNIGSIAGIRYTGVPYIAYATTKSGVLGLSRSVAIEHALHHIRSNVIMPGLMKTPFVVEPLKSAYADGNVDKMMEIRDAQCPMGHMGDAWDVAYAALFLASDEARYVTGAELVVDGGITAKFS